MFGLPHGKAGSDMPTSLPLPRLQHLPLSLDCGYLERSCVDDFWAQKSMYDLSMYGSVYIGDSIREIE